MDYMEGVPAFLRGAWRATAMATVYSTALLARAGYQGWWWPLLLAYPPPPLLHQHAHQQVDGATTPPHSIQAPLVTQTAASCHCHCCSGKPFYTHITEACHLDSHGLWCCLYACHLAVLQWCFVSYTPDTPLPPPSHPSQMRGGLAPLCCHLSVHQ